MQISDDQVRMVRAQLAQGQLVNEIQDMDLPLDQYPRPEDAELIEQVVQSVAKAPDREDRIAELRAKIASGQYNPTGDEIADTMIRRAIADQIR